MRAVAAVALVLALTACASGPSFTPADQQFLASIAASPRFVPGSDTDRQVFVQVGQQVCSLFRDGASPVDVARAILTEGYSVEDTRLLMDSARRAYSCEEAQ